MPIASDGRNDYEPGIRYIDKNMLFAAVAR